jgi:hypothetical protein
MIKKYLEDSEFSERPLIIDIVGNNRTEYPGGDLNPPYNKLNDCLKITEPGVEDFIKFSALRQEEFQRLPTSPILPKEIKKELKFKLDKLGQNQNKFKVTDEMVQILRYAFFDAIVKMFLNIYKNISESDGELYVDP